MGAPIEGTGWRGPGSHFHRQMPRRTRFRRALVAGRYERSRITASGVLFVALTLALGTAAYNAGNNLLFLALSLLLACLILNGILAWVNFGGAAWRLRAPERMRAGEPSRCAVEVANGREWTPLCALLFEVKLKNENRPQLLRLVRALAPRGLTELTWDHTPTQRGSDTLVVSAVASLFPFGFLRKSVVGEVDTPVIVHPARIRYDALGIPLANTPGRRASRNRGEGSDLLGLRPYKPGDAQRSIHWKATARTGRLMVRELAHDADGRLDLRIDLSAAAWPDPAQFERMVSLTATLVEDLSAAGSLRAVRWGAGRPQELRRAADILAVLDRLATAAPDTTSPLPAPHRSIALVHIAPTPDGGVQALLHGHPIAIVRAG